MTIAYTERDLQLVDYFPNIEKYNGTLSQNDIDNRSVSVVAISQWTDHCKSIGIVFTILPEDGDEWVRIGSATVTEFAKTVSSVSTLFDHADEESAEEVATVMLREFEEKENWDMVGEIAVIDSFYIEPELRKKGFGRAAFKELIHTLAKDGVSHIFAYPHMEHKRGEPAPESTFYRKRIENFLRKNHFEQVNEGAKNPLPLYMKVVDSYAGRFKERIGDNYVSDNEDEDDDE